jgi:hypothetical protein
MSAPPLLPEGFAALEPFVDRWALRTTADRDRRRSESRIDELEEFFAAAQPLLESALACLDKVPPGTESPCEQRLMDLMMSLAHVSIGVEVHKEMEARHAEFRRAMLITRSVTDPA